MGWTPGLVAPAFMYRESIYTRPEPGKPRTDRTKIKAARKARKGKRK